MDTKTGNVFYIDSIESKKLRDSEPDKERYVFLPYKPNPDCKVCSGRGSKKSWGTPYLFGTCPSCYPDHEKRAVSFKNRLKKLR